MGVEYFVGGAQCGALAEVQARYGDALASQRPGGLGVEGKDRFPLSSPGRLSRSG